MTTTHTGTQSQSTTSHALNRPSLYKIHSDSSDSPSNFKFPDFQDDVSRSDSDSLPTSQGTSAVEQHYLGDDLWQARKDNHTRRSISSIRGSGGRHTRQSLSDAFNTIRARRGSISANAHEIADALKAPISIKLILLCVVWYTSSALTNTSSKSILNAFPKPITLTFVQFGFVATWCLIFSALGKHYSVVRTAIPALKHGIRYPNREVIATTIPLAFFQLGGHVLSSTATSKIPVSLVHTIKGLSPLFTVLAYRFVYRIHYGKATYLSLIPLTIGVMLACSSTAFKGDFFGVMCAFFAALVFVSQNIFSKTLFNKAAQAEADGYGTRSGALDKLNLLFYSSGLAFVLTTPLWLFTEGFPLLGDLFHDGSIDLSTNKDALDHGHLTVEFLFNGIFHFGQNIMAFILLSKVSPVTYSVASLIKRVFVIVVAIIWFRSSTTSIQAFGIALTFVGLYLYDRANDAEKAERHVKLATKLPSKVDEPLLPLANGRTSRRETRTDSPPMIGEKKSDDPPNSIGRVHTGHNELVNGYGWLPPGTKQEDTWIPTDIRNDHRVSVS
ncbi:MAG: suppressor of loss of ypt1 [Cirrosporium novae-zelandiae]|nr:MAG: suppressor of loss of ypt1 [Cirrosporium novae-zelandiae]